MTEKPKVAILLLNYNGWELAIACLESIYRITYPNWKLLFVDNGSENTSVEKIKEWANGRIKVKSKFFKNVCKKPIDFNEVSYDEDGFICKKNACSKATLLKIKKNGGFSRGNNVGIKYLFKEGWADYIVLLSNDTVVYNDFLDEMIRTANSDKSIGIVGGKLIYPDGTLQHAGGNYLNGRDDDGQYNYIRSVESVCGACILVKKDVFEKIGLLDESYSPAYYEDVDYCFRARRGDFKIMYNGLSTVVHKESKATFNSSDKEQFYYYAYCGIRNQFMFYLRYIPFMVPEIVIISFFKSILTHKDPKNKTSLSNLKIRPDFPRHISCFTKALKDALLNYRKKGIEYVKASNR